MLKTERLRILGVIVVATVVAMALGLVDLIAPQVLDRIWRGHFPFLFLVISYLVFMLFEGSVLVVITRHLQLGGDVPQLRRYVGAFIETSIPTVVLWTHMSNMGAAQALAFVGPFLYFVFIILSTSAARLLAVGLHRLRRKRRTAWRLRSCIQPLKSRQAIRPWRQAF